jgi:hypothetical protein
MFRNNTEIHLMPQQVTLRQTHGFMNRMGETLVENHGDTTIEDPQNWAIEACHALLAQNQKRGNLHVIFSDLWARYELIQLGEAELSDQDLMSLAQAQFSRQYPVGDSAAWPLRLSLQEKRLLIAGMNPALYEAVTKLATSSGKKLAQAEPLFAKMYCQFEKEITKTEGWILLDEPEMLLVAYIEQGQLFSIHSQRCDHSEREKTAKQLLDRQAALISRPAGAVRIFSYSGSPLALKEPWLSSQFRIVGPIAL